MRGMAHSMAIPSAPIQAGTGQSSVPAAYMREQGRAPVAQLHRLLPSEGKGHRFESCRARHLQHAHFRPPRSRDSGLALRPCPVSGMITDRPVAPRCAHRRCCMPLVAELNRRKVFNGAAAYALFGWLVIEVVGFFLKDRLGQTLFGGNTYLAYGSKPVPVFAGRGSLSQGLNSSRRYCRRAPTRSTWRLPTAPTMSTNRRTGSMMHWLSNHTRPASRPDGSASLFAASC